MGCGRGPKKSGVQDQSGRKGQVTWGSKGISQRVITLNSGSCLGMSSRNSRATGELWGKLIKAGGVQGVKENDRRGRRGVKQRGGGTTKTVKKKKAGNEGKEGNGKIQR